MQQKFILIEYFSYHIKHKMMTCIKIYLYFCLFLCISEVFVHIQDIIVKPRIDIVIYGKENFAMKIKYIEIT